MANYQEQTISGSEYVRCNEILISNPLGLTPTVRFSEEKITLLSNRTLSDPGAGIQVSFDPSKTFPVLNPMTGEATGDTSSWGAIYTLVYSAYVSEALTRDNGGI